MAWGRSYGATMATPSRTDRIATDGGTLDARVTVPEGGTGPGLVLIHEIFGVNDYVRDVADRLAAAGYVVVAPDLFWRIVPNHEVDSSDPDLMPQAMQVAGGYDPTLGITDLAATLAHVRALAEVDGPVGVIGFCFGGTEAARVAIELDPAAAVSYYGSGVPALAGELGRVSCPMLLHFGADDPYLPRDDAEAVAAAVGDRPELQVHLHDGAGHAFDNSFAPHFHDPAAAAAAWETTLGFLAETLAD